MTVRCVARDRHPRPPRHQPRGARPQPRAGRRPGRDLPRRRLPAGPAAGRAPGGRRRRRPQRGDRRRVGDRQGDPRPLHAPGGGALPGLRVRRERRLLDARAPRGDHRATGPRALHRRSFASIAYSQLGAGRPRGSEGGRAGSSRLDDASRRRRCQTPTTSKRSAREAGQAWPPVTQPGRARRRSCSLLARRRPPAAGRSGPATAPLRARLDLDEDQVAPSRATRSSSPRASRAGVALERSASPARCSRVATSSSACAAQALALDGHRARPLGARVERVARRSWRDRHRGGTARAHTRRRAGAIAFAACSPPSAPSRCSGSRPRDVRVEVDVRRGLPAFAIVGLPDAAVRESRERVRAALVNSASSSRSSGSPRTWRPADLRKAGPGLRPGDRGGVCWWRPGQLAGSALADARARRRAGARRLRSGRSPACWRWPRARGAPGCAAIVVAAADAAEAALVDGARGGRRSITARELLAARAAASSSPAPRRPRRPEPRRADAGCPTSPTCAASRRCAARSRSPRRAATAC